MKSSAYSLYLYRQPPYMEYPTPFLQRNLDPLFYDFWKISPLYK